jgi:hypothetical protein
MRQKVRGAGTKRDRLVMVGANWGVKEESGTFKASTWPIAPLRPRCNGHAANLAFPVLLIQTGLLARPGSTFWHPPPTPMAPSGCPPRSRCPARRRSAADLSWAAQMEYPLRFAGRCGPTPACLDCGVVSPIRNGQIPEPDEHRERSKFRDGRNARMMIAKSAIIPPVTRPGVLTLSRTAFSSQLANPQTKNSVVLHRQWV